ncbi:MAG: beta-lactamase family protein [Asgard group archaeon]|nr:beta-lactamase family protein [Asgard group archaeon]
MKDFELILDFFEEKIVNLKNKYKIPGMSIAISYQNELIYAKGFGYADIENKIKATSGTPYRIASLTKPIASVIILQLVEQGLIDLDASIATYLPNYLEFCRKNKAHLETATFVDEGEIKNYSFLMEGYNFEDQNITIRHHLQQTITGDPGEEYKYNGALFGFLGIAVDNVVEEKFIGFLRKNIIEALDMRDTLPKQDDTSKPEILNRLAKPYKIKQNKKDRKINWIRSEYPDGDVSSAAGIVSTVLDYLKFDKALDTNQLISEKTKEMAFTNPKTKSGKILPYGLGFFVQTVPDIKGKIIWHYGYWPESFSSLYLKIPSEELALVLMANSDGLSRMFDLGRGDVTKSPFTRAFFETF